MLLFCFAVSFGDDLVIMLFFLLLLLLCVFILFLILLLFFSSLFSFFLRVLIWVLHIFPDFHPYASLRHAARPAFC